MVDLGTRELNESNGKSNLNIAELIFNDFYYFIIWALSKTRKIQIRLMCSLSKINTKPLMLDNHNSP